jgi:hypothetical protein
MSVSRLTKTGLFQRLPFETGDGDVTISRELKLFRAVLDKALIDSFSDVPEIKQDVEDWLDLDNQDFLDVCAFAFLDPELVYGVFKVLPTIIQGEHAKPKKFHSKN